MIKDIHGREIEVGDEVVSLSGTVRPWQVLGIQEPSSLADPTRPAMGSVAFGIQFEVPVAKMPQQKDIQFTDLVIVRKFTEIKAPPGTKTQ